MTDKEQILELYEGESYIVPESDYGKAEVFLKHGMYFLFSIPMYGGLPVFVKAYTGDSIEDLIREYESWT